MQLKLETGMASAVSKLIKAEKAAEEARAQAQAEIAELVMDTGAYRVPAKQLRQLLQAAAIAPADQLIRALEALKPSARSSQAVPSINQTASPSPCGSNQSD